MRRLAFLVLAAALLSASSASAALEPLTHGRGEIGRSLVHAGTIHIPRGHARGLVRVVVRLRPPPLAAAFAERQLTSAGRTQLDVQARSSRLYLRRLASEQQAAAQALRRAIPSARIGRRFRVVLDGLTVTLPARRLPTLVRLSSVSRVYPSLRYTLATNESPAIIGAPALEAQTGARGDGMKIAVVDDGIDAHNRFFRATGYSYPAGFPKGQRRYTTAKVIVARSFPGPGAGRRGRLPLDREVSFHGTHVAGIAAGDAGTNAPKGPDHPAVTGLSGVAPRAYLGNYRVFTVPTPVGVVANTPEIIAAFEAAVRDGMNVINFSGGGSETDPVNDALIEAITNVARAGVVPVISAGNDRDDFGLGSVGSPGTAPDAITVAASTNTHVFAPALSVSAADTPQTLQQIPFQPSVIETPKSWAETGRPLVDVSSLVGRAGKPIDTHLCGPARNPNGGRNPLPRGSLRHAIALVSRGNCTFESKAGRVALAGGIGMVLIDNRPGEGTSIPVVLDVPAGTIPDLDGSHLRAYLADHGGRALVKIGRRPLQLQTGRGGVMAFFSSGGPTAFTHALKPDVTAPGTAILSSTLRQYAGGHSPFAVFDGTSMAAPHVSGSAALLLQLHPSWTPEEVKSALVSTAGPAWDDTGRSREAPVTLEGGGLENVVAANDPRVFTDPTSLSFGDLDVSRGSARDNLLLSVTDATGAGGTWQVAIHPQSATAGSRLAVDTSVSLSPGGTALVPVSAVADADAQAGESYGFLELRQGGVVRRVPYLFLVTRPALAALRARPLHRIERGTTRGGRSLVSEYRFPTAPFGEGPGYPGPAMDEGGSEHLYALRITQPVANAGVAVTSYSPASALIHPWFLGSQDENDVQGYAGTPVNVNDYMLDYGIDLGVAGASFPREGRYFVSVDSGDDPFSHKQLRGRFVLRSWINDVRPPRVQILTPRASEGRPIVLARITDSGSGVDPYSVALGYGQVLVSAAAYDPDSGLAVFALPFEAPALHTGRNRVLVIASDNQEAKNLSTPGDAILPNTAFRTAVITRTRRAVLSWVSPRAHSCIRRRTRLLVLADSTHPIRSVRFFDGTRRFRTVRRGASGLYTTTWQPRRLGAHALRAVARDARGRTATATRAVRVCR